MATTVSATPRGQDSGEQPPAETAPRPTPRRTPAEGTARKSAPKKTAAFTATRAAPKATSAKVTPIKSAPVKLAPVKPVPATLAPAPSTLAAPTAPRTTLTALATPKLGPAAPVGAEPAQADTSRSGPPTKASAAGLFRRPALIAALAAVALALVGASVLLGYRLNGSPQPVPAQSGSAQQIPVPQPPMPQAPETAALLAAGQHAIETIGTFSHSTVDADLKRILAVTTGDLRNEFQAGLTGTRTQIVDQQLTKKATVLPDGQGVVEASATKATITLLIRSEDSSKDQPSVQVRRYRVGLTMVRSDGQWLVSAVTNPTLIP